MQESNDVQALEKISAEVDDSQVKIILSSQCIKAQALLVERLRKQSDRQKETCNNISSGNFKLENEIKNAEVEIQSLMIAVETIQLSNVELKKEWLLSKERKSEIIERVTNGEKKYDALWQQCKSRYESLPYVKKWLESTNKSVLLKENLQTLEKERRDLLKEIKMKNELMLELDRKRVIELAKFLVHEMPTSIQFIKNKSDEISAITKEIALFSKQNNESNLQRVANSETCQILPSLVESSRKTVDDGWPNLSKNNDDDSLLMPKLKLGNIDLDNLSVKLDQIKKHDAANVTSVKRTSSLSLDTERLKRLHTEERTDYSSFFNNPHSTDNEHATNYSNKKLINILEDITLDDDATYSIVSKVTPSQLLTVQEIRADAPKETPIVEEKVTFHKAVRQDEEIAEVESSQHVLIPPSPFLDNTQENFKPIKQNVQSMVHSEDMNIQDLQSKEGFLKKVSFDIPSTIGEVEEAVEKEENDGNITINSQLDASLVSEDNMTRIKDMILKKHHLDLSPQFVYAKHSVIQKPESSIVTSKFFKNDVNIESDSIQRNESNNVTSESHNKVMEVTDNNQQNNNHQVDPVTDNNMEIDDVVVATQKSVQEYKNQDSSVPVAGFLFSHGPRGIPESLDLSISTTGFEDGDGEYPNCIDSSLLLSPKADIDVPITGQSTDVHSQDVPNFLSGLRKTGLSFFGGLGASGSKTDSSSQNQANNFNFNFGGDDKKTRGGLFSMFR